MQLPRLIGVAVVGMLALSCSDSTGPTRVTALYLLESIDGEPLPATFASSPIETSTVFWATLNLDEAGNAAMAEHRYSLSGGFEQERTHTQITVYEISGEFITLGHRCRIGPLIDCAPNRVGRIEGSSLRLSGSDGDPNNLTYVYRLAASN